MPTEETDNIFLITEPCGVSFVPIKIYINHIKTDNIPPPIIKSPNGTKIVK